MKTIHALSILILLIPIPAACGPLPPEEKISGCTDTVSGVRALWTDYPFPESFMSEDPVEDGSEFDPNAYFTVLDGLGMEPGYTLDFVYTYDWLGGYPTLLARPESEAPYLSWADVPDRHDDYFAHLQADGTPESYFQLAVMSIMARQFYLYWHANYNDVQIVCDHAAVQEIIDDLADGDFGYPLPLADRVRALAMRDLAPSVDVGEASVEVRLTTFSKWGGFYRLTYTFERNFPHTILDVQDEELIPYDCGVMF
jgi:hypothetical protein